MSKRIACGVLWALAIYLVSITFCGSIAAFRAGNWDPENGQDAMTQASAAFVFAYWSYFFVTAFVISAVASTLGVLPGTEIEKKSKKRKSGATRPRMTVPRDVPDL